MHAAAPSRDPFLLSPSRLPEALVKLDPDSLEVQSFAMSLPGSGPIGGCCTGCVSGCGINPTAGGCDSQGNTYEYPNCGGGTIVPMDAAY